MTLFELGRLARELRSAEVWLRADGAVQLALAGEERPAVELGRLPSHVRQVHYHPGRGEGPEAVQARVAELRTLYPGALIHGLSPGWAQRHGLEAVRASGVDSFCWFTGELGADPAPAAQGWERCSDLELPSVAAVVYGPEHSVEQLTSRLARLGTAQQVVLLPRSAGDLVVVRGATTDGPWDIELLSRARASLPAGVRVRASWGALGFKLAQSALAFGADALAGWGLEEQLAYSGKMRSADVIGWEEARAGVQEAGFSWSEA